MFIAIIEALILIVLGGIFELDRTAAIQSLASEPIVVAPVVGWVVGEPILGLKVGIILQLFFLGMVSIGGSTPTDGTLASLAVAGCAGLCQTAPMGGAASLASGGISMEALTAGSALLLMVPASRLGRRVEAFLKEQNVALAHNADDRVLGEGSRAIEKIVHRRLKAAFAIWAGTTAATLCIGTIALNLFYRFITAEILSALEATGRFLPLAAAGVALSAIKLRRANIWYAAGCLFFLIFSALTN